MKPINHKTSARLRKPQVSLGSDKRIKAMRRVGITQLTGTNPVWWVDYSQTQTAEGTAIDAALVPQRKAVSWAVSGPAARAAWTSEGLQYAGAQAYSRGTGDDINGQTQLSAISVYQKTTAASGQLVETHSTGFFNTRGIVQATDAAGLLIQSEGPVPTNARFWNASVSDKVAAGCYWDTANADPNLTELASIDGSPATLNSSSVNVKGTPFSSNNLYLASRSSSTLFFQGLIKVQLFFQGGSSQKNLNELTRVAQWSVR